MSNFKKLLFLLTPQERKHSAILLLMILVMALLDMIGVASILPFMAVITNPSLVETQPILNTIFHISTIFGVENNQDFLFALGILVFILLVISLSFKALTTYMQVNFVQMREYSISKRLVEGYLHQPYDWFLNQHSADLGKTILSEVGQVIGGGIRPLLDLIAKSIITITLITLLIIVDPKLTLIVSILLFVFYGFIFFFIRSYLNKIGKKRLQNNQFRFTSISEAFGAVKEIKVGGLEQSYIKSFSDSAQTFAKTQAISAVISQLPRFFLEAIAFGGIILIILYMMSSAGSFNNALPIISLYVFVGYRLIPALQQIYGSITRLTFVGPSVDKMYEDIKNLKPFEENQDHDVLSFDKTIALKNISYNYPNTSEAALKDISLIIPAKSTVGIVGATGSGKTTTVDIMLGLLEAQKGTIEVDGQPVTKKNLRSWQRSIGYVPQHIYLSDSTVAANIAFGVEINDINQKAVERAAKIANLHKFILDQLPNKYQTKIGERGVRLSGGQRQRIGIARALYHNPKVLILDEATNALDNQTEKSVMDEVYNFSKNITIILITHRLNIAKKCNKIFLLNNGVLKNQGTLEKLILEDKNLYENT